MLELLATNTHRELLIAGVAPGRAGSRGIALLNGVDVQPFTYVGGDMPFTAEELTKAGRACLDFFVKNNPIDQIGIEHPWLKKLMGIKKTFPGGKQYIVEQIRYRYQTNFQWYYGDAQVNYNKRDTLQQAQFPWRSCHDGYSLNEDELLQNGITLIEGKGRVNTEAERLLLTNLLDENNEALDLGFKDKFDYEMHRDGTQSADSLEGLDKAVSLTPSTGTYGGLNRATFTWWRNYATTGIAQANLVGEMEKYMRLAGRQGGSVDFIMLGSTALDTFRAAAKSEISRYTILKTSGEAPGLDPGTGTSGMVRTGLHFHGIELLWNPLFSQLDADLAPGTPWEKRIYMLTTRNGAMKLRPAQGHDMVVRNPPRVYDRYTYYWGLTWKGGFTCNRLNGQVVLAVA